MRRSNTIVVATVLVAIIVVAAAAIYISNNKETEVTTSAVDFAGQEIVTVDNLDGGIVAVGQDTFRWVTYFGLADKCVMVDQNDMSNFLGKAFMYSGRAQVDIDGGDSATLTGDDGARKYFTHTNCGITMEDARTIVELNPSIVVVPASFYTDYRNEMAMIENQGINTVAIGYIYTFLEQDTFEMTDDLVRQISVLSTALDMNERGTELQNAFRYLVDDLRSLTSGIGERRSAYIGALSYNGAHGISSSSPYFIPMELAGIDNILAGKADYSGSGVKEYSAKDIGNAIRDDTILFVDASGYATCATDNTSNGIIKMFQGHESYIVTPYIWTGVNYESVFVCAYQMVHAAYGDDILTEEEMLEKINTVHDLFLGGHESTRDISQFSSYSVALPEEGTTIFEDMSDLYTAAKGNPIHGEVTVSADGHLSLKG